MKNIEEKILTTKEKRLKNKKGGVDIPLFWCYYNSVAENDREP